MGLFNNEPHCGSEACVTATDKAPEEGNIKFEEQDPEVTTVLPTQPEPEVSEWFLCIRKQHFMLAVTFTATKRNSSHTLQLSLCTYIPCIGYSSLSRPTIAQRTY